MFMLVTCALVPTLKMPILIAGNQLPKNAPSGLPIFALNSSDFAIEVIVGWMRVPGKSPSIPTSIWIFSNGKTPTVRPTSVGNESNCPLLSSSLVLDSRK